jgi:DNA-nicking Smr family endonuclease
VKKKYSVTSKDKKDWDVFTKQIGNISAKESDFLKENVQINKVKKLDLHGSSLVEANERVKNFIIKSFNSGYKKLLVITGKGLRSKSSGNPYLSETLSTLKYAVPEYIRNDESLNKKITRISEADLKDGGTGAIYIFLKNNKKFTE